MLQQLVIRDLAIISGLDITFQAGLNVLTGETGAGKSIIIGALELVLGAKASPDLVRAGADRAVVDAVFDLSRAPHAADALRRMGFDADEEVLVVSREVSASGRSSGRIAGRPASATQLREIGEILVDLHGQHEHQSLMSPSKHIAILDDWAGPNVDAIRARSADLWRGISEVGAQLAEVERDARERARTTDLLTFQVQQIEAAELTPGEDAALEQERRRLANSERLAAAALAVETLLQGDDGDGILTNLALASREAATAADIDAALADAATNLDTARFELEEVARTLSQYRDAIEHDPHRLEQVNERLDLLRSLERKYGDTAGDVLAFLATARAKLDDLSSADERSEELRRRLDNLRAGHVRVCAELTEERTRAAAAFAAAVEAELAVLAMQRTRFQVQIDAGSPGPTGADRVEFLIATNIGEPLRPLAKIASGGEISRVMLAIKSAMARQDPLPTMVFDEIDVGVGGRTAAVIGDKLHALSRHAQVLCITHLPQIAGQGDHHLAIVKSEVDGRADVTVLGLAPEERVREVVRMLGGSDTSETVERHARELLAARPHEP
ncbi:MAG: DNA repair protein RecN [Armatimonadetes bacterium]|nr:DNA repair protein RecN [Armatimonadota bacterium]